ncbi:hypothetical protein LCGC14_1933920 [marine sediment metagenome]|uniref:Uncharacterized protein n=1 Tax=marine sediment metagenome TaxID=412755 RepID=A0A0F9GAK9_9ZZZZ
MRPQPKLPLNGFITGYRNTLEVFVDGVVLPLEPSLKVRDHSPTGFCWGYHGSGPSQLALALLLNFGAKKDEALAWYQDFKREVIANLPDGDFEIPMSRVSDWLTVRRIFEKEFGDRP